jgi:hypothetical protein
MRKLANVLFLCLGLNTFLNAAPGDTTWVQANHVDLDYYNKFDDTVAFPDGSLTYRKILMVFTLGQYNCPTGSQYCHQWDYTVQNYIMTSNGDTIELNRLITPYATAGWPRFGSAWAQPYVFDVTDYASLLKDSATVRIFYSGYSGGFTADIKFAFIEGIPDRNVVGLNKLYDFSHQYGNPSNPMNSALTTANFVAPPNTESAVLHYIVTGHGSDDNQCCEFDSHSYKVNLNGTSIAQHSVWRDNCAMNELYPQGGTWLYNRANWCPGAAVLPVDHLLTGVSANSNYNINIQYEPYTGSGSFGSYTSSATVFYYAGLNKNLDASLENIISPTNNPNYYRENPSGNKPKVWVHNAGSTTITSIDFKYSIEDSSEHTYTWTGNIASLSDTAIELPEMNELSNMAIANLSGTYQFNVEIVQVNGQTDQDPTNNKISSQFNLTPLWPSDVIIRMKTSNLAIQNGNVVIGNPNQKWEITNMNGALIASRNNTNSGTQYSDTVSFFTPGLYQFKLTTDNGMGLHWWPYDGQSGVIGGALTVKKMTGPTIPMKNYSYSGTPHDDWGDEYIFFFAVNGTSQFAGIKKDPINMPQYSLNIYPNPAQDVLNVNFNQKNENSFDVSLMNALGQNVYFAHCTGELIQIQTNNLINGVYFLTVGNNENVQTRKVIINQ